MWTVLESRDAAKALDKLPVQVLEKYAAWLAIVRQSGPQGLRRIRGFRDEQLKGKLSHQRSSRLNQQYRVIYEVRSETVTVSVERVTPHKY